MSGLSPEDAARIHERLKETPLPGQTRQMLARAAMASLNAAIGDVTGYAVNLRPKNPQLTTLLSTVRHGYRHLETLIAFEQPTKKSHNHCSECSRKLQNDEPVVLNKPTQEVTCLNCHLRIEGQLTVQQQVQLLEIKNANREIIRSGNHEVSTE